MATTATTANKSVFSFWWAPLLEGLAAIGFGAALFLQPAITLIVLTTFLGAYWLVDGLFKVVAAFSGQSQERSWWIMLLSGLLGIFAGIIVFGAPLVSTLITQVFLVYMLAVQAIIGGLLSIVWAIRARKEIRGEGWAIAGGILAILLGVVLMSSPLLSVLVLARVTAILAIAGGVALVVAAFQLRNYRD